MSPAQAFKFDFAISYAGEEKGLATDLARLLRENGAAVFIASHEKVYLLGRRLRSELTRAFGPDTRFALPIISKHYVRKYWTRFELAVASREQANRPFEFILPMRLDDAPFADMAADCVYMDLRQEGLFNTVRILLEKLRASRPAARPPVPQVWTATFGLSMEELAAEHELPPSAPQGYPYLCDWLEDDLMKRLRRASLSGLKLLEDSRTGETLSVRVAFGWDPEGGPLDLGDPEWWEVLEVAPIEAVYPQD